MEKRSAFSGKLGFVLAAAASAVGVGNIWRFPYLAAKYGGGMFILIYIVIVIVFGFALMAAEIAIGRKTGQSAVTAYGALSKKFSFVGFLTTLVPIIITPYYCVIGGWIIKYMVMYLSGNAATAAATTVGADGATITFFDNFLAQGTESIGWFLLFLAATGLIVFFGVEKGIERVCKYMLPGLIVLLIIMVVMVVQMPGAGEGYGYLFIPKMEDFTATTVLAALGQVFYSMSIAMGILITYGSYMKKNISIESSVSQVQIFDTGVALLAAMVIIPAVYVCGQTEQLTAGPGLIFKILPQTFAKMGDGATVFGSLFFIMFLAAALTSSVSLMEAIVSIFHDKFKINKKACCLIVVVICVVLGIPSALGYGPWAGVQVIGMAFLDFFDFISNTILIPIVALFTCIFVGYVIKPKCLIEEIELTGKFRKKTLFTIAIKYIGPVFIVAVLIFSLMTTFGVVTV